LAEDQNFIAVVTVTVILFVNAAVIVTAIVTLIDF
jgi:hypothetical protein